MQALACWIPLLALGSIQRRRNESNAGEFQRLSLAVGSHWVAREPRRFLASAPALDRDVQDGRSSADIRDVADVSDRERRAIALIVQGSLECFCQTLQTALAET